MLERKAFTVVVNEKNQVELSKEEFLEIVNCAFLLGTRRSRGRACEIHIPYEDGKCDYTGSDSCSSILNFIKKE